MGADGVTSLVRRSDEAGFGASLSYLTNRFAWFGTSKVFDTLSQTFIETPHGPVNAHHYRYSPTMSTFLVECGEQTFFASGFDKMTEDETRIALERIFAQTLDGHPLISNRSIWRQFPIVHNERWSAGNKVILGDALHTAHFSIGSGTRLAIEDAIALARAIKANPRDARAALAAYEAQRKPILDKLVRAANASADWYENFGDAHGAAALRLRDVVSVAHRPDGHRAHPQGGADSSWRNGKGGKRSVTASGMRGA